MRTLEGRVAVITGGASGIGLAMAETFGAQGMKLVVSDIETVALGRAVDDLKQKGFEVLGVPTDVRQYADVEALRAAALDRFEKIHVVCLNAGVSITGPVWKMTLDDWRWVYEVNVWGVIHGIKAFTPYLIEQNEAAHIVTTASMAAFDPIGEHAPYCSSKAAVWSMTQALHSELVAANTPIGVSLVCPGMVATQIHKSFRNRPAGDKPWSDREFADADYIKGTDAFQGRGIPPKIVADAVVAAVKENRFWVFTNPKSSEHLASRLRAVIHSEQPDVRTWGPDMRPVAVDSVKTV